MTIRANKHPGAHFRGPRASSVWGMVRTGGNHGKESIGHEDWTMPDDWVEVDEEGWADLLVEYYNWTLDRRSDGSLLYVDRKQGAWRPFALIAADGSRYWAPEGMR